jgi:signal transduction histidine kinase
MSFAFALVLSATVAVFGGFVFWSTIGFMDRQTNTVIETDIEALSEVYQRDGLRGLIATIESRIERDPGRSSIYLVADAARNPVVGNISAWPESMPNADGWIEFSLTERVSGSRTLAKARPFLLRGQVNLLVGRDIRTLQATKTLIEQALAWGTGLAICVGISAGLLLSRRLRRRLRSIIRTSRDVMRGDLSRRVPDFGSDDDLDEVARNLNAMLDETQRLLTGIEHVTNNVAHDLRTPLARLRNRLAQLRDDNDNRGEPGWREEIDACVTEVDRLLATFGALLRIAKLEAAGLNAEVGYVDLGEIATAAVELYEPLAEDRGLSIKASLSQARVRGERELLLQAVCNLLDNAIKFSPAAGSIEVALAAAEADVSLDVSDHGPGIDAADQARVFERFYRGDSARQASGSGLGLALVRAICSYHGATITLLDNNPGLRVRLSFPPLS